MIWSPLAPTIRSPGSIPARCAGAPCMTDVTTAGPAATLSGIIAAIMKRKIGRIALTAAPAARMPIRVSRDCAPSERGSMPTVMPKTVACFSSPLSGPG